MSCCKQWTYIISDGRATRPTCTIKFPILDHLMPHKPRQPRKPREVREPRSRSRPTPSRPNRILLLRRCKHSFQANGIEDLAPPVPIDVDVYGDLWSDAGWELFEKAICVQFNIHHWLHCPFIHYPDPNACDGDVEVVTDYLDGSHLQDKDFPFEKIWLVHFETREKLGEPLVVTVEDEEREWERDPAREFLEELDREMEGEGKGEVERQPVWKG